MNKVRGKWHKFGLNDKFTNGTHMGIDNNVLGVK